MIAARYLFYEMPSVQKRWCGYCIVDAVAHLGTFILALPEARDALAAIRTRRSAVRQ